LLVVSKFSADMNTSGTENVAYSLLGDGFIKILSLKKYFLV